MTTTSVPSRRGAYEGTSCVPTRSATEEPATWTFGRRITRARQRRPSTNHGGAQQGISRPATTRRRSTCAALPARRAPPGPRRRGGRKATAAALATCPGTRRQERESDRAGRGTPACRSRRSRGGRGRAHLEALRGAVACDRPPAAAGIAGPSRGSRTRRVGGRAARAVLPRRSAPRRRPRERRRRLRLPDRPAGGVAPTRGPSARTSAPGRASARGGEERHPRWPPRSPRDHRGSPREPRRPLRGGEIDQDARLNIISMTDEEKGEMRDRTPRTRGPRAPEALSDATGRLHGTSGTPVLVDCMDPGAAPAAGPGDGRRRRRRLRTGRRVRSGTVAEATSRSSDGRAHGGRSVARWDMRTACSGGHRRRRSGDATSRARMPATASSSRPGGRAVERPLRTPAIASSSGSIGNVFLGATASARRPAAAGASCPRAYGSGTTESAGGLAYALHDGWDASGLLARPRGGRPRARCTDEGSPTTAATAASMLTGWNPCRCSPRSPARPVDAMPRILVVGCEQQPHERRPRRGRVARLSAPVREALTGVALVGSLLAD